MSTLVVFCHPVPESFGAALTARVVETLADVEAEPRLLDLYTEGFAATDADASVVAAHREAVGAADALVLVYPTWWSGLPAMLAGWFEQVVAGGSAPASDGATGRAATRELLTNLNYVTIVTTHGSSKLVNVVQGEAGKHFLQRSLHPLCPPHCRMRWLALYNSDRSSDEDRQAFLDRIEQQLRSLA